MAPHSKYVMKINQDRFTCFEMERPSICRTHLELKLNQRLRAYDASQNQQKTKIAARSLLPRCRTAIAVLLNATTPLFYRSFA